MSKIRTLCHSREPVDISKVNSVFDELGRTIKMFFLKQKMKGMVKEYKEDYFV